MPVACDVWDCVGVSLMVLQVCMFSSVQGGGGVGEVHSWREKEECPVSSLTNLTTSLSLMSLSHYSVLLLVPTLCNVITFLLVALCAKSVSHAKCLTLEQTPKHQVTLHSTLHFWTIGKGTTAGIFECIFSDKMTCTQLSIVGHNTHGCFST